MPAPTAARRSDYPHHLAIPTRWMDNDVYGHVNNVVYYSYFDTVINTWLIERGGLDIVASPVIGLCVESRCSYLRPLSFPSTLSAGLRVARLGSSSVQYAIGIFAPDEDAAAAQGEFTHVFVDRAARRPTPIPPALRAALERLVIP